MVKIKKGVGLLILAGITLWGIQCKKEVSQPPEVRIITPKDRSVVSGIQDIAVSVEGDYNGGKLDLLIDSITVVASNEPYISYQWHTDTLPNGSTHSIKAELHANDTTYSSEAVTVTVINDTMNLGWQKSIGGPFFSAAAVDNNLNVIYVGSDDSYVYALNRDGDILWRYKTNGSIYSSISIDNIGNIYFGSCDGNIYSLDANGLLRWKFQTGGPVYASVAISSNGEIYAASSDSALYVLSDQGDLLWSKKLDGAIFASPAITSTGSIWVATDNGTIYLLTSAGNVEHKTNFESPIIASLSLGSNDKVYAGTYGGDVYALNTSGNILWHINLEGIVQASIVVGRDGSVYAISTVLPQKVRTFLDVIKSKPKGATSYIYAIDGTGKPKYTVILPSMVVSTPVITSDNRLVVADVEGEILLIADNGTIARKTEINATIKSHIALTPNGDIYIGSQEGNFYYLVAPFLKPAYSGWPMFGFNNHNVFRKGEDWLW